MGDVGEVGAEDANVGLMALGGGVEEEDSGAASRATGWPEDRDEESSAPSTDEEKGETESKISVPSLSTVFTGGGVVPLALIGEVADEEEE